MTPVRIPLGSIPGIATLVVCAFAADISAHHHVPLHAFDQLVRIIEDRR